MLKSVALILALFCGPVLLTGQNAGTIKGIVVDEHGQPVDRAQVHVVQKGPPSVGHRILNFYETNNDGRFVIENVSWGTYLVLVGKESAGYPDTKLAFYSNLAVPTVTLAPAFPIVDVALNLPSKAGVLVVKAVLDAVTKKNIDSSTITLRRLGTSFQITTSTVNAKILVPSLTNVSVEIDAPGYASKNLGQFELKPEETRTLTVSLFPMFLAN